MLEGLAVRMTAERIDDAGAARLRACLTRQRELLERGDLLGASDANADLHATLLELSGHGTARRLIRALNSQTVRYQYRTILIPGRPAASVAEHAAIVEAVVGGHPDAGRDRHAHATSSTWPRPCGRGSCRAGSTVRAVVSSDDEGDVMPRSLEDVLAGTPSTVDDAAQRQDGAERLSGRPGRVHELAGRAAGLAEHVRPLRPVVPHGRAGRDRPRRAALLSGLAVNSFDGFVPGKAKHFVPCTPEGYVIGDVILFALAEDTFNLVGRAPALNWVTYHAETGDFDVSVELDQRTALRTDGRRKHYRFQVQGPNAMQVTEKALGAAPPELKFFNITHVTIAGKDVGALRHGMVGQPGWELFGPWDDRDAVLEALLDAGEEFGLRRAGGRAYSSNTLESGWIPSPLPAVYSGEGMKLPRVAAGDGLRGDRVDRRQLRLGRDRGLLPHALGPRLRRATSSSTTTSSAGRRSRRWPTATTARRSRWRSTTTTSRARSGRCSRRPDRAKFMDWPSAVYSMHPYDRVTVDGETAGLSTWIGYSANEGRMLTLAILDAEHAEPGLEVTLVWGEEDGGTEKTTVEPHVQTELRAVVCPAPYVETARTEYRATKV